MSSKFSPSSVFSFVLNGPCRSRLPDAVVASIEAELVAYNDLAEQAQRLLEEKRAEVGDIDTLSGMSSLVSTGKLDVDSASLAAIPRTKSIHDSIKFPASTLISLLDAFVIKLGVSRYFFKQNGFFPQLC